MCTRLIFSHIDKQRKKRYFVFRKCLVNDKKNLAEIKKRMRIKKFSSIKLIP